MHGALNTIVIVYGQEEDWQFQQFVSQAQLDKFAADNSLRVIYPPKEEE